MKRSQNPQIMGPSGKHVVASDEPPDGDQEDQTSHLLDDPAMELPHESIDANSPNVVR